LWQHAVNPAKIQLLERWAVGTTFLDVGTGHGRYSQHMRQRGFAVTAIDADERLVDKDGLTFLRAVVPPLPVADASFDTLAMFDLLEHVADEDLLLRELRRVVRQRVIISVPADDDGPLPRYGLCHLHHVDKTHHREYGASRLRQLLETHGFRVLHLEPQTVAAAPLVVEAFFTSSGPARLLRGLTSAWIRALRRAGVIRVDLAADWLVVAEVRN
jgi:ubiquinone/menaquinone biosynthesis C-methylase UbiE